MQIDVFQEPELEVGGGQGHVESGFGTSALRVCRPRGEFGQW